MISNINKDKINKMNRASQNVQLGSIIQGLENFSSDLGGVSGSISITANTNGTPLKVIQLSTGNAAQFGNQQDYVSITSNGTLRFTGSATFWNDLVVPLTQARVGVTSKPDFDYNEIGYLFPANDTSEILYFIVQMPHSYKVGSDVNPHVHYRQTTGAGSPVFKMDYKWFNINSQIPNLFSNFVLDQQEFIYTSGCLHQINAGSALLSGSGKDISSIMLIKLYRDDTSYPGDVLTFQFDLHYESDSLGSDLEYIK